MAYVGLAPTSVWIWRPSQVDVQDHYRTLVTEFENGAEQRRGKWNRPRMAVRMQFDRNALSTDDVADIWRFYRTQRGSLRPFDLPLFGQLTTVESLFSSGSRSIGVADTQDFTSSATSRWNKVHLQNGNYDSDVFTVTSVNGSTRIEVQSATGNTYQIGNPVSPVITARFADDVYGLQYLVAQMTGAGLVFTEVRS